ncbi:MAG: type II toxin-antitoxin system VapC family toxin [Candidatus Bathyarchaeia archaeon]|jgi:predicted nucleic acid-binding protein
MKCLDTDILIAILRGKEEAKKKVDKIDEEDRGATTSVNAFELFFGANKSERKQENLKETSKLLERLTVFPLDFASSRKAAEISATLAAKGETIDFRDAMIAAIAVENGLTLVTRNQVHFKRIKGLQIESW